MAKCELWPETGGGDIPVIHCPGCGVEHAFDRKRWSFNDDLDEPTFHPSMLVRWGFKNGKATKVCHSFVTDGKIRFLNDSTHDLAGQTVELPDMEELHDEE